MIIYFRKMRFPTVNSITKHVLITFCLLSFSSVFSQAYELKINKIVNERGFDPGATAGIVQDSLGYIWFGTVDGLYRFDGFNYTVFRHDDSNDESLSNNLIRAIALGRDNKIWIGTQGSGLDCFDLKTEKFRHYVHNDTVANCLSGNEIWSLAIDHNGDIWIGSVSDSIDKLDLETGVFSHYPVLPSSIKVNDRVTTRSLLVDHHGIIYAGLVRYGVSAINIKTGEVKNYIYDKTDKTSLYYSEVRSMLIDSRGNVLIACFGAGLFVYDKIIDDFILMPGYPTNTNLVSFLLELRPDLYLVGTEAGLIVYDAQASRARAYHHEQNTQNTISDDRIRSLFVDKSGIIWVGNEAGVDKIVEQQSFKIFQHKDNEPNSFPSGTVRCIIDDVEGNIWIGIINKGLVKYNPRTKLFEHFLPDYNPKSKKISGLHITSLLQDSNNDIWIGEWDSGLNRYNNKTGTFDHVAGMGKGLITLSDNRIQFIREESPGVLWVGTENGLNKLYIKEKRSIAYFNDKNDVNSLGGNALQSNAYVKDSLGNLWLGAWSGGLTKMEFLDAKRESAKFTRWSYNVNGKGGLTNNNVISLHLDKNGLLWIGTFGSGINRLNTKTGLIDNLTTDNGLPNNVIFGILEDDNNEMWFSSERGLSNFKPSTGIFYNYNKTDGLQDDHFYWGSTFKSRRGELFFGGISGLNSFLPSDIKYNTNDPRPVITGLKINEERVDFGKPLWMVDELVLPSTKNYLTIEFAALDYNEPKNNIYSFKMENVDKDWRKVTRRIETYSNLEPGEYVFRLRVANNDGFWSSSERFLKIEITPPWNKTWWARSLFVLLAIGVVIAFYRFRVGLLEKYTHKLEDEVTNRTQEIVKQKVALQAVNKDLNNKNDEISSTLQKLRSTQQKLVESEKMASLGVLTAGVAHEINNPLNFIHAGITGIESFYGTNENCNLKDDEKVELNTLIESIKIGVQRVSGIVTSLNHFSRQTESLDQKCDVQKIIDNCLQILNNQLKYKVDVVKNYLEEAVVISGNEGKLHQLFINIIGNSIQAIDSTGTLTITLIVVDKTLEVHISDTGCGISEANLQKIYDPFFTTKEVGEGTGLGLSIVYGIVMDHKGKIKYNSTEGVGTEAVITFPL